MACCSDELAEDLGNLFGDQLEMKDQTQLFEEMKRLAVVSQKSAIFHSISYNVPQDEIIAGYRDLLEELLYMGRVEMHQNSKMFVRNKNLSVVARQDVDVG